jgi:hypothetical protein
MYGTDNTIFAVTRASITVSTIVRGCQLRTGSNNTIGTASGDSVGVAGGGNTVSAGAGTTVVVSTTAGSTNYVASNGATVDPLNGSSVAVTGTVSNPAALAWTPQTADAIDEVYLEVLGRPVDASGLAGSQITAVTLGAPQHIAFVGGFFDSTISDLSANGTVQKAEQAYRDAHPGVDVQYFTWDQGDQLSTWAGAAGGSAVLIAHSYRADTAATVVASGVKVATLVTLDPVSYFRPDFSQIAKKAGQWFDYNATGRV